MSKQREETERLKDMTRAMHAYYVDMAVRGVEADFGVPPSEGAIAKAEEWWARTFDTLEDNWKRGATIQPGEFGVAMRDRYGDEWHDDYGHWFKPPNHWMPLPSRQKRRKAMKIKKTIRLTLPHPEGGCSAAERLKQLTEEEPCRVTIFPNSVVFEYDKEQDLPALYEQKAYFAALYQEAEAYAKARNEGWDKKYKIMTDRADMLREELKKMGIEPRVNYSMHHDPDEIAVKGPVVLVKDNYTSAVLLDPTWREIAFRANEAILANNYCDHIHLEVLFRYGETIDSNGVPVYSIFLGS